MSRAFVRESDEERGALPERAVSTHPNFVTPRGLAAIEARVQELTAERQAARAQEDAALRARVERDLRYWNARRASARLVEPVAAAAADRVRFGMRVTLLLGNGARQEFRLVGEDEADAAHGLLSWVSPLGQSLLARQAGESVSFQGGEAEIISIEP
jgi:transcription elongation GreA/GreB family factor